MSRLPLLPPGTGGRGTSFERASANDLMELATDVGPMRVQIGALLRLAGPPPEAAAAEQLLVERTWRIPRLRQVLRRVPPGCGRPVWVDDPAYRAADHVRRIGVPGGDDAAAVRAAADLVAEPMSYARPLWRAGLLVDPAGAVVGIAFAVHHVLADGIGGLAVLARLMDGGAEEPLPRPPRPLPTRGSLAADAMRSRVRGLRDLPAALASVPATAAGFRAGGRVDGPATSLSRPVSGRLEVAAAHVALAGLHDAAHRAGATVNDAILAAVAGAVREVLAQRGEQLMQLHVSVPVSLRSERSAATGRLGNRVGAMLLAVPATGAPADRLRATGTLTRQRKAAARAGSGPVLVALFRAMAALHLLRPFIERQHMVQAFVSNVPGPAGPVRFAGSEVAAVVPITTLAGNVALSFLALSYAGDLVVTISADPAVLPDVAGAARLLGAELQRMAQQAAAAGSGGGRPSPAGGR